MKITVSKDGPYLVEGSVPLARQHIVTNSEGESLEWKEGEAFPPDAKYALCRCGHSTDKPFCDGTHKKVKFDGTETANREPYAQQKETFKGPALDLDDAEHLCAFARFCDPKGRVWNRVEQADPESQEIVKFEAGHCPAGRLVAHDHHGKTFEPHLPKSIGLVEDTAQKVAGPIWVRGGVPVVSADGHQWEVRNRMTLCRCGASSNKPFCDGSHASIKFRDDQ
jgi:CDGSH-type Zn-finger protein